LNTSNSEKLVLWVGRGYPNKDPFTFLKSVENIAHRIPNAVFVMKLWNKGPLDIKIQKRVEDSSTLRKRLFIVRNISWERLPDLYASCDLFVHTSSNEGFGLAVAEAMSSGKPVIIADRGGPTEFVGKGGLQFKSGDHVDLSNKVEELLLDEDSRKRIAVAAKEIAFNTLSWKVAAERYIELYQA
ncbi:MAG: glycosyltransferase family 4 protein, partial [Thaumarchaeota archaeon]|nr:glycosyltransferase family 4 protein [Nitrososphaerota archaeon]